MDVSKRSGRFKAWVSRITKSTPSDSLSALGEFLQPTEDIDGATLYPASVACLSDVGSPTTTGNNTETVLDAARINAAVAMVIRAKQQDQLGGHTMALHLMTDALEQLALSLPNTCQVQDDYMRERLAVLKLLLLSDTNNVALKNTKLRNTSQPAIETQATDSLYSMCVAAASVVLQLVSQVLVIWLFLMGSIVQWLALQFKRSRLPEATAEYLVRLVAWMHRIGKSYHLHEYLLSASRVLVTWLTALDKQSELSQKLACSLAAVLGAIARVVESITAN
ncbi:hypothetical protein LPJ78_000427 [Coemansia sp. RSA 989]|nr:hypothetical protein BX667DRAFT_496280 [Coemansia mojavensis]KAJ1744279.1 hypothetical protein LPJ68_000175 [Coemansia sp. RSA 1086]KAJ1868127.1 hypothetical protein LPJ78_000427 [Coemansia sp. RSA 989]KAJ1875063.1 hypothetical protein LPJ55_001001 [Coemansia sp. RSA 990]KAJ2631276.1 hypothetical protein H4R22_002101 [Coemansia sp. RSA 1290]KAJ2653437.1 hypothetical protein IWW40_000491 [Coemansia sp. RSA 1250]KAJ2676365.1 hypothetical protein IWW42_000654 [Coemansia sp. RSA 1085]